MEKFMDANGVMHAVAQTRAEEQIMSARVFIESVVKRMRREPGKYSWLVDVEMGEPLMRSSGWTEEIKQEIGESIEAGLVRMIREWDKGFPTLKQVERMHREFDELREACKGMSEEERRQKYDALNEKWDSIKANEEL